MDSLGFVSVEVPGAGFGAVRQRGEAVTLKAGAAAASQTLSQTLPRRPSKLWGQAILAPVPKGCMLLPSSGHANDHARTWSAGKPLQLANRGRTRTRPRQASPPRLLASRSQSGLWEKSSPRLGTSSSSRPVSVNLASYSGRPVSSLSKANSTPSILRPPSPATPRTLRHLVRQASSLRMEYNPACINPPMKAFVLELEKRPPVPSHVVPKPEHPLVWQQDDTPFAKTVLDSLYDLRRVGDVIKASTGGPEFKAAAASPAAPSAQTSPPLAAVAVCAAASKEAPAALGTGDAAAAAPEAAAATLATESAAAAGLASDADAAGAAAPHATEAVAAPPSEEDTRPLASASERRRSPSPPPDADAPLMASTLKDIRDTADELRKTADLLVEVGEDAHDAGAARHATAVISARTLAVVQRKLFLLRETEERTIAFQIMNTDAKRQELLKALTAGDVHIPPALVGIKAFLNGLQQKIGQCGSATGEPVDSDKSDFRSFATAFGLPSGHLTVKALREEAAKTASWWLQQALILAQNGADADIIKRILAFANSIYGDLSLDPIFLAAQALLFDRIAENVLKFAEQVKHKDEQTVARSDTPQIDSAKNGSMEINSQITAAFKMGVSTKHPHLEQAKMVAVYLEQEVLQRIARKALVHAKKMKAKDDEAAKKAGDSVPEVGPASRYADNIEEEIQACAEAGASKTHPDMEEARNIGKALRDIDGTRKRERARQQRLALKGEAPPATKALAPVLSAKQEKMQKKLGGELVTKIQNLLKFHVSQPGVTFQKLFDKYDKDKSGKMNGAELKKLMRLELKIPVTTLSDKEIDAFVSALDDDGSGDLDAVEIEDFIDHGAATFGVAS